MCMSCATSEKNYKLNQLKKTFVDVFFVTVILQIQYFMPCVYIIVAVTNSE